VLHIPAAYYIINCTYRILYHNCI